MSEEADKKPGQRRRRRPRKKAAGPAKQETSSIASLVKPSVQGLVAYQAKEIPCKVKLDANESPFGFKLSTKPIATNRYPDPEAKSLRISLARGARCAPEQVLTGNGSDELIYYLIATFGGPVLYPTPTFSMYGIISRALGEETVEVPLDSKFDLDINRMLDAINKKKPKLIFLSTPNNPTGNRFSDDRVMKVIKHAPGIVVVDEAYQPFAAGQGYLPLLGQHKRMVVLRTLSKIGLAALRVGYMVADTEVASEVNKVRLPFNLNSLSQLHAEEALTDKGGLKLYTKAIIAGRALLMKEMKKVQGVEPFPSEANFILFRVADAERTHAGLLRRGVLVRNLGTAVKGCLRVTVGSEKENAAFLKALKETMKEAQGGPKGKRQA